MTNNTIPTKEEIYFQTCGLTLPIVYKIKKKTLYTEEKNTCRNKTKSVKVSNNIFYTNLKYNYSYLVNNTSL